MTSKDFNKDNGRTNYDADIEKAKRARNSQRNDTNPLVEKEGFLGVDDLDRLRRRKIR